MGLARFVTDAAIATMRARARRPAHRWETGHRGHSRSTSSVRSSNPILLFIDNVEHVIAVSPALGRLLDVCKPLRILVTSREVLHLSGECEFPVARWPFPAQ